MLRAQIAAVSPLGIPSGGCALLALRGKAGSCESSSAPHCHSLPRRLSRLLVSTTRRQRRLRTIASRDSSRVCGKAEHPEPTRASRYARRVRLEVRELFTLPDEQRPWVSWHTRVGAWRAGITVDRKRHESGHFDDERARLGRSIPPASSRLDAHVQWLDVSRRRARRRSRPRQLCEASARGSPGQCRRRYGPSARW